MRRSLVALSTLDVAAFMAGVMTLLGCVPSGDVQACPRRQTERACVEISRTPGTRSALRDAAAPARDDDSGSEEDFGTDEAERPRQNPPRSAGTTRQIFVAELQNARDLGGVPAGTHAHVAYDQLFRGPPLVFSTEGCDEFAQLGLRTIVDLRVEEERLVTPDAACTTNAAHVVLAPLPVPYNLSPDDYITDLYTRPSIVAVFAALGDPASYPVYFHCTWGRDRTGILAAVILLTLGASREAILDEYLLSQATVGAYPDSLAAMLDEVERVGGIAAYLASIGVTQDQVATLRARALGP